MTATIPLAKGFDLSKMTFPAYLSIKHDGVPVKLMVNIVHDVVGWDVVTRSGKPCPSVHGYCREIVQRLVDTGYQGTCIFVAEITHKTLTNFKDISGVVRKKTPQENLIWNVFDHTRGNNDIPFKTRRNQLWWMITKDIDLPFVKYVHQTPIWSTVDAMHTIEQMQEDYTDAEGLILVSGERPFKPGARHWDYQKIVVDPVSDLRVIGFEEAVSASGEPLGMVGRIIVEYNGKGEGCGPGKLTHDERIELWAMYLEKRAGMCAEFEGGWPKRANLIAAVKHKRDPSYSGLRQPTFQHWREDKDEPNEE